MYFLIEITTKYIFIYMVVQSIIIIMLSKIMQYRILEMVRDQKTPHEISKTLGINYRTARKYAAKYQEAFQRAMEYAKAHPNEVEAWAKKKGLSSKEAEFDQLKTEILKVFSTNSRNIP